MAEVKTAPFRGFLQEFNRFQSDMTARLHKQEERIAMLNTKTMNARPTLSAEVNDTAPRTRRRWTPICVRAMMMPCAAWSWKAKALNTAVNAEGGFLVDPETSAQIQGVLNGAGSLRAIANVVQIEATSFDVLVDHTDIGAGWASRNRFAGRDLHACRSTASPSRCMSFRPCRRPASAFSMTRPLISKAGWPRVSPTSLPAPRARRLSQATAWTSPSGMLNHPTVDNDSLELGQPGLCRLWCSGDFAATNPADAIVDLVYALGARYRANATFMMNSKTAGAVRKMKDADGRFLWSDGLAAGEPARLMGYPVLIAEDMPDIAVDSHGDCLWRFPRRLHHR